MQPAMSILPPPLLCTWLPLFQVFLSRLDQVSFRPLTRADAWRLVQRRAEPLGLRVKVGMPLLPGDRDHCLP